MSNAVRLLVAAAVAGMATTAGFAHATTSSMAPDPSRMLTEYAREHWTIEEGLPQNSVMAIAQDPDGFIWIATFEGLAQFDGHEFLRFLPVDAPELRRGTTDLLFDDDGTMWVGTQSAGLFRISADHQMTHFTEDHGLARNIVWSINRDVDGELWVGTAGGLCRLSDEQFVCLSDRENLLTLPIPAVLFNEDGSIWVGTEGGGLLKWTDHSLQRWNQVAGRPMDRIRGLARGDNGAIWIATFGAGLVEYDGEQFRSWHFGDDVTSDLIGDVLVDPDGAVWIGTYGNGLHRIQNGDVDSLDFDSGLPNGHIQSLLVDREGSLWFGTNGGLNQLRLSSFSTLSTEEGLAGPYVRSIAEDLAGDIWVGTDSMGLSRIHAGRVVAVMRVPEILANTVRSLWPAADGGMWVGAYGGGLSHLSSDGQVRHYTTEDGLTSHLIRAILEDAQGRVWVGTDRRGVTRISTDGVTPFTENEGMPSDDVRAIAQAPDGSVWFGTYGSGLARFVDGRLTPLDLMPDGIIFSIHFEADGAAWIGAEDGLYHYWANGEIRQVASKDGLDGAVFQVLDDQAGMLWLCTNRGVVSIEKQPLLDGSGLDTIRIYESADGLRSRQCNGASQPSGWRGKDGRLWFPTANGVSWVDPDNLVHNPLPPPVVIGTIQIDDVTQAQNGAGVLTIPPGLHRLEIRYSALSFVAPEKITFRYRLEAHDPSWIEAGSRRSAFYNDLPPGDYRFHVIAANADGVWNENGARLGIVKLPLYYQTFWFQIIAVISLGLMIMWIIRRRSLNLIRQNAMLEATVHERTEHLAATNSRLENALAELETTHDQLIQAGKLAALGRLVAGVAHEVNTPVGNGLTLTSHLLERTDTLSEAITTPSGQEELDRFRQALNLLQNSLERAGAVVSSFKRIAVSREKTERRTFLLSTILSDARLGVVQQIQTKGHLLVVNCPEDIELDSYPEALYELLTHLTVNSLDHAFPDSGGTIAISAIDGGDTVELEYRDDGRGINSETLERLYEPFVTGQRGTQPGLGMHIVYNIVSQLLGGEIQYQPGTGACFRITVPKVAPN